MIVNRRMRVCSESKQIALPNLSRLQISTVLGEDVVGMTTNRIIRFFDNDASNFEGLENVNGLVNVKVIEGPSHFDKNDEETAVRKSEYAKLLNDNPRTLEIFNKMWKVLNEDKLTEPVYFDAVSGVTENQLSKVQFGDAVIVDWDRTMTCVEGFIAKATGWDQHMSTFHKYIDEKATKEEIWTLMFGGDKRVAMLSRAMKDVFWKCGRGKVFVVSKNPSVHLCEDMLNWLLKKDKHESDQDGVSVVYEHIIHSTQKRLAVNNIMNLLRNGKPMNSKKRELPISYGAQVSEIKKC